MEMKKGLVLEGGAMRGMFTAGILDVWMEKGITFDGAAGVSAGAVFGCNFKSGQKGRAIRYNKKYCTDPRYASYRSLFTTGNIFGVDFCYDELPHVLDPWDQEAFKADPMDFYCVCTDIVTGKPVYHLCKRGDDRDIEWFRASASMPLASTIVEIGGRKLLDGGVSDSIPLRFMEHKGYNRNVVILTQPLDYVKSKNNVLPLVKTMYRNYPGLIRAMEDRHLMYNKQTAYVREQELKGEAFVIRPPKALEIGHISKDPDELQRVYDIGTALPVSCKVKYIGI